MKLIDEMKNSLPLYVYPTPHLLKTVNSLLSKTRLEVTSVMDSGDAGGITCGIKLGDEVLFVSLTHLDFRDEHPLQEKIKSYQKERINSLRVESFAKSVFVGRNDICPCGSGKKYKKCCGK
jgi:hypothetical protein